MLRNRIPAVVLAVSLAATAAGCGGDEAAPGGDTSVSPSASPTPSFSTTPPQPEPAATKPPKPPEPADTTAGKKLFARHVVDAWGYALATNDPSPMVRLSPKKQSCVGCQQLTAELRRRTQQGWYVDFAGAQVKRAVVKKTAGASVATLSVAIPESDSYNDDGSYRSTSPAHPKGTFEVEMRFQKGGFELVSFRVS